ncbi:MAG: efflux RND transporter periplasmic adaptor subunit [Candidatus Omnitrophica bacterium]|nr:efflux RND transporter periplasmic adaptor subunit [Candidatus Omnitrophota bacterium]
MICRRIFFGFLILLVGLTLGCEEDRSNLKISGRIEVDDVHIGSKVGGRVSQVNFDEGDSVEAGAVVVALEDDELSAQLKQAQANAAEAQAKLDLLLAGSREEDIRRAEAVVAARSADLNLRQKGFREEEIREADAQVQSAKSDLDFASAEYQRAVALLKNQAINQQEFDGKRSGLETAKAKMEIALQRQQLYHTGSRPEEIEAAQAQLAEAQSELDRLRNGSRPEEIAAQQAAVLAAEANIARLKSQLDETRICSPSDAIIQTLDLEQGDLVKAGQTFAILNLKNRPWVRCYVPENRLGMAEVGREVTVSVDSYPEETFPGKIMRISSDAEFTPRNVQTTEKRSELVFEMKVDILEKGEKLRGGMYADVHIEAAK